MTGTSRLPGRLGDQEVRQEEHTVLLATMISCPTDRKSTRLNSSHLVISYAVFCLKKKTTRHHTIIRMPDGLPVHRFFPNHHEQDLPFFIESIYLSSISKHELNYDLLCNNFPTLL